mgnify:FL=1
MHLRNTLAKGMDAESYSLHTFEALLTQSMENLGTTITSATFANTPMFAEFAESLPGSTQRSPYPSRKREYRSPLSPQTNCEFQDRHLALP